MPLPRRQDIEEYRHKVTKASDQNENVKECVISEDVVIKKEDPILLYEQTKKQA